METSEYLLLAGVGLLAGIINVIAGGGSLLTLPTMILMGIPAPIANGTNRVAILAQNITAVSAFRSKGLSNFRMSWSLALCTIPGAIAGAICGAMIRGDLFNQILAAIMIGIVILMAFKRKDKNEPSTKPQIPPSRNRLIAGHLSMIIIGFYGGFIQAGVGFLIMASLNHLMRLDLVHVNMHKVFIVATFTVISLIVYIATDKVWWIPGLALAVGNSAGGWIGSQLTITKGEVFVQRCLYIALIAMAVKLVI